MKTEVRKTNTLPDCIYDLIGSRMIKVEECITQMLKTDNPLLTQISSYICSSGGKRIRPILLLLSSQLSNYNGERDILISSIIEFIHAATLLHDDVIDQAAFRRGSPSANKRWGDHLPVLVGDYLYARSFYWLVDNGDYSIMSEVSSAVANVTDGEIFQLYKSGIADLSEKEYMWIISKKTASLISACCKMGGLLGRINGNMLEALEYFGTQVGIAYQLVDDALDFLATDDKLGKPTGNDIKSGNATLPLIKVLSRVSDKERFRVRELIKNMPGNGTEVAWAVNLVKEYRGAESTLEQAREHIKKGIKALDCFDDSIAKKALVSVAQYIVKREF